MVPAHSPAQVSATVRFGRFELQMSERRLLVDGQPANLGGRALDLLAVLAARPDALVSKGELFDAVWPGLVVEENNLQVQVSALRKVLGGDAIATVPGRGYRFAALSKAVVPPAPAAAAAPPAGAATLPAGAGRLIGRGSDLARVERALQRPGCCSLVGPGGVGKTRLAVAVAQRWPARCAWVDLASLTAGEQVGGALARQFDLPLAEGDLAPQIVRAIGNDGVLVVLDNAEHLVDACARWAERLLAAPNARVLVTSQQPLAAGCERVQRVEPLDIESGAVPADGALAFLIDRIEAAGHRVCIDATAMPLLADIARQLDGLPLALEMAAARVPLLGVQAVRDELAQRFSMLTAQRRVAPRHRSLHSALDWSYSLLDSDAQQLFAALGVFAGGFTLELCVALADDGATSRWELIDRLAVLVDHSLVAVGSEATPRYRLLETMRAYALERLASASLADGLRRRHSQVLLELLERKAFDQDGIALAEMDNVREAIAWAENQDLTLAAGLSVWAVTVSTFSAWRPQAYAWIRRLEPLMVSEQGCALELQVRVDWWAGLTRASIYAHSPHALAAARTARQLARELGDPVRMHKVTLAFLRALREPSSELDEAAMELVQLVDALPELSVIAQTAAQGALAWAAHLRGAYGDALAARIKELELAQRGGRVAAAQVAECNIAIAYVRLGRHQEGLTIARAIVDRLVEQPNHNIVYARDTLVAALIGLGRLDEARRELPLALADGIAFSVSICVQLLPLLAEARGRAEAAARLVGYTRSVLARQDYEVDSYERAMQDALRCRLQGMLGVRFEDLVDAGSGLDDATAAALACDD